MPVADPLCGTRGVCGPQSLLFAPMPSTAVEGKCLSQINQPRRPDRITECCSAKHCDSGERGVVPWQCKRIGGALAISMPAHVPQH